MTSDILLVQAVADAERAWAQAGGTAGWVSVRARHEMVAAAVLRALADQQTRLLCDSSACTGVGCATYRGRAEWLTRHADTIDRGPR